MTIATTSSSVAFHSRRSAARAAGDTANASTSMPLGTTRMRAGSTPAATKAARTPPEIAITRSTARL